MKKVLASIVCLSFLLASCEKRIPIPHIESEPVLAINALIDDVPSIRATLSTSESLQNFDTIPPITDAIITIETGDGSFSGELKSQGDGTYSLVLPKTNKKTNFTIKAHYVGYTDISAKTIFYPESALFKIDTHAVTYAQTQAFEFKINVDDVINVPNYYLFGVDFHLLYKDGTSKSSQSQVFSVHPFVQNKDIQVDNFELSKIFIPDTNFDGQSIDIPFIARDTSLFLMHSDQVLSCKMDIEIISVTQEVYQYLMAVERLKNIGKSNFTSTVQIPTNIKNGTGIFGSFRSFTKSFTLK